MYCIYTDKDVPDEAGNWDHVIPLSLGGKNGFVVWAEERINSVMGSAVDGALVRDPLLALALRNSGVKGHGGKPLTPVWKNATLEGRPIQVTLGGESITAWDARERRELTDEEFAGKRFQAQLKIGLHTAVRFLAKVALGAGHFIYGDDFRHGTDCDELRALVMLDLKDAETSERLRRSRITVCDRFHPDSREGQAGFLYRVLCETLPRSIVIAVPHDDAISFHVGIVGEFIGTLTVPANTMRLPLDGEHDLGHVIVLAPGDMQRLSFRDLLAAFYTATTGQEPPEPPTD